MRLYLCFYFTKKNSKMKNKVIAIAGPTASGKTKLAIEMAQQLGTEIISADSRLVYKGFDIGTAKPTKEEQKLVKHYLIDVVEPEVDYSVADFADEAGKIIDEIHSRGKVPIIAGGTGLYFRILLENYDLPRLEANPELRAQKFSIQQGAIELSNANVINEMINSINVSRNYETLSTLVREKSNQLSQTITLGRLNS